MAFMREPSNRHATGRISSSIRYITNNLHKYLLQNVTLSNNAIIFFIHLNYKLKSACLHL